MKEQFHKIAKAIDEKMNKIEDEITTKKYRLGSIPKAANGHIGSQLGRSEHV